MKKLSIILVFALVAMMSCKKEKEIIPEIPDENTEIITVGVNDVHVQYTRTDHAEFNRALFHYCPADASGNAQQFEAAEMTKEETFFELTLNDLLSDTLYWYYYELFPNNGDAFTTDQKTFHTQASDTPEPPTPPTPSGDFPEGAVNGLFTINENGDQVYFSKGNLQYQASTRTWRFAELQWDYVGNDSCGTVYENGVKCDNALATPQYSGWIDLYCWGTSGYNHGAVCYQPWSSTYEDPSHFYAYGNVEGNLNDQKGDADWGYNPIINGGNAENTWRTLTASEWDYLLNTRTTSSGMSFTMAIVNDINGAILLPDNWSDSCFLLANTHHYFGNVISAEQWATLEECGAVFLPAAGMHYGNEIVHAGEHGNYWSASCYIYTGYQYYYYYASHIYFISSVYCDFSCRPYGESVRLVQDKTIQPDR